MSVSLALTSPVLESLGPGHHTGSNVLKSVFSPPNHLAQPSSHHRGLKLESCFFTVQGQPAWSPLKHPEIPTSPGCPPMACSCLTGCWLGPFLSLSWLCSSPDPGVAARLGSLPLLWRGRPWDGLPNPNLQLKLSSRGSHLSTLLPSPIPPAAWPFDFFNLNSER